MFSQRWILDTDLPLLYTGGDTAGVDRSLFSYSDATQEDKNSSLLELSDATIIQVENFQLCSPEEVVLTSGTSEYVFANVRTKLRCYLGI